MLQSGGCQIDWQRETQGKKINSLPSWLDCKAPSTAGLLVNFMVASAGADEDVVPQHGVFNAS